MGNDGLDCVNVDKSADQKLYETLDRHEDESVIERMDGVENVGADGCGTERDKLPMLVQRQRQW